MTDYINKPKEVKGHFTILSLDKDGNILDKYEDNNMIMETARNSMADNLSGISVNTIDKIVFGTEGHKTGDVLTPKDINDGFIATRTELFSEEEAKFNYPIEFTVPGTTGGDCTGIIEPDNNSKVHFLQSGTELTYTVDLADEAGNNSGTAVFTEAALYAQDRIFSMKCFKAKVKDSSVLIRVIWKIQL